MSYIKREPLLQIAKELQGGTFGSPLIVRAIEEAPTEDVVEVVRCKDCKRRNTPDCKMWYQCVICGDYHHWERDEDFCSCGERRTENE